MGISLTIWKKSNCFSCCVPAAKTISTVSSIERLPDDVLIYLLLCPDLDFATLSNFAYTSQRMRALVYRVLQYYLLPNIQIAATIDQEGRGRWTSYYKFLHLDPETFSAIFCPFHNGFKRYRCDGSTESPTLRHLMIVHTTDQQHKLVSVKSSFSLLREARGRTGGKTGQPAEEDEDEGANTSSAAVPSNHQIFMEQARRLGIRRCGLRKVQARGANKAKRSHSSQQWELSYFVDQQRNVAQAFQKSMIGSIVRISPDFYGTRPLPEPPKHIRTPDQRAMRYIIPVNLSVHVSALVQQRRQDASWTLAAVNWIKRRCSNA